MNIHQIRYSFLKKCCLKISTVLIFSAIALHFTGCTDAKTYGNTVKVNGSVISSVSKEVESKTDPLSDDIEGCVFWTKSGAFWHTSIDCHYLSRSKTIIHGTVEDAMFAGKSSICSSCSKRSSDSSDDKDTEKLNEDGSENITNESGVEEASEKFFWVKSGKVYHKSANCRYISNSENVICGTEKEAKESGKERICSACGASSADEDEKSSDKNENETETVQSNKAYETEDTVFWVNSGKVYHTESNCRYISNSKNVNAGTLEEAEKAGISKPCSACQKHK